LDSRSTGIIETDNRAPQFFGEIHNLNYFFGMHGSKGAAEHRKVLREYTDGATVHCACSCDDTISGIALVGETEIRASVRNELIEFTKRSRIEQQRDTLAGREFTALVLLCYPSGASTYLGFTISAG
jgi:hypothetical protein